MTGPAMTGTPASTAAPPATDTVACSLCGRAAFFMVRLESPVGRQHSRQRTHACSRHVVEILLAQRAWASNCELADGWLTVLAIDPYAPRRLAAGVSEQGLPFYSISVTPAGTGNTSQQEGQTSWLV
jgi:hypothetical protein